jgi:hypothetical protein
MGEYTPLKIPTCKRHPVRPTVATVVKTPAIFFTEIVGRCENLQLYLVR